MFCSKAKFVSIGGFHYGILFNKFIDKPQSAMNATFCFLGPTCNTSAPDSATRNDGANLGARSKEVASRLHWHERNQTGDGS